MSEASPPSGLGLRMAKGAAWMIALRISVRMLGVVSTVILARLLAPEDFGLIALAALIGTSIELLSSLNFQIWLVRHPEPTRADYDTVWTLSVLRGLLTAALLALLAPALGQFFNEPRLEPVLFVLAFAVAAAGFQNVGIVDFQRRLEFDKDFRLLLAEKLSAFLVTVSLALWLRNYWALAAGIVTARVVNLALSYHMHAYRPRLGLSRFREGFHFAKWLLLGNIMLLLYKRADIFILGRLVSSQLLGLYSMAHEIANLASTELVTPISRVLLPGYARIMHDSEALRRAFLDGFALILALGVPCAAGLGLAADPLVRVALGDRWLGSITLIQILAIYAVATVARGNVATLLLALGQTRLLTVQTVAGVALMAPSFYLATLHYGLSGGALAAGLIHMLFFLVTLNSGLRLLRVAWLEVGRAVWRVLVATALMAPLVLGVIHHAQAAALPTAAVALLAVSAGALGYAAGLVGLWCLSGRPAGAEQIVLDFARARLGR